MGMVGCPTENPGHGVSMGMVGCPTENPGRRVSMGMVGCHTENPGRRVSMAPVGCHAENPGHGVSMVPVGCPAENPGFRSRTPSNTPSLRRRSTPGWPENTLSGCEPRHFGNLRSVVVPQTFMSIPKWQGPWGRPPNHHVPVGDRSADPDNLVMRTGA